jgi:hypothetical protein
LQVLRDHGVAVDAVGEDDYELLDMNGDVVVVHIPNPVLSETLVYLYRLFGALHGFEITALVKRRSN